LADRRIIDAALPDTVGLDSAALAGKYRMGDQVEIACEPTSPAWEESTARYQFLKITELRLIRRPSAMELGTLLSAVPFREGKNLLERPAVPAPSPSVGPALNAPGGRELANVRIPGDGDQLSELMSITIPK
jgi:hypothetical protein